MLESVKDSFRKMNESVKVFCFLRAAEAVFCFIGIVYHFFAFNDPDEPVSHQPASFMSFSTFFPSDNFLKPSRSSIFRVSLSCASPADASTS